jgi:hypothetical protein
MKRYRSGFGIFLPSVTDPKLLISDPGPTGQAITDPDPEPTCLVNMDPDPTFQVVSDLTHNCK